MLQVLVIVLVCVLVSVLAEINIEISFESFLFLVVISISITIIVLLCIYKGIRLRWLQLLLFISIASRINHFRRCVNKIQEVHLTRLPHLGTLLIRLSFTQLIEIVLVAILLLHAFRINVNQVPNYLVIY